MSLDVKTIVQVLLQQRDRLYAYLWTIVGDTQLAEDTLQELSLVALEKGVDVEDERRLAAWLRVAARLKAYEMLRSRGREPLSLSAEMLDKLDVYWQSRDAVSDSDVVDALRECIGQLTANNRRILAMRYIDGKKPVDIATMLGRRVDAVYKAVVRIHTTLRACMEAKLAEGHSHE